MARSEQEKPVTILVTGGAGFVGSVLTRALLEKGYRVRVLDSGFFGLEHVDKRAELVAGDILEFDKAWLYGVEAVIHLAGLSNDPMAAFSPSLNYMLNAGGAAIVAQATKDAGIRRFVFASTCSVYGRDDSELFDEERPTSPTFPYAISKLMAERLLGCLTDDQFRPIILRKGTVVGWSPRMRFDLVTNTMVKTALTEKRIVIHNPALWRPLIDVEDASQAYLSALEADLAVTGVFNISTRNYTLAELGTTVADELGKHGVSVTVETQHRPDVRSYRVKTDKAARVLNFKPRKAMNETVRDLVGHLITRPAAELEDPRYYNIRQMERLMAEGRLHRNGSTSPIKLAVTSTQLK
jgi:nucleoside-diphosphate-sugar epimerase